MVILPESNFYNMESEKLTILQSKCLEYLKVNRYSEATQQGLQSVWKCGIDKYAQEKHVTEYTCQLGQEFLAQIDDDIITRSYYNDILRSVRHLDDMLTIGKIQSHKSKVKEYNFDGVIGSYICLFIAHLKESNLRPYTIQDYKSILSSFLEYLKINGINDLTDITEKTVSMFIAGITKDKTRYICKLRRLFAFWQTRGLVDLCISEFLSIYRLTRPEPIPSYYTPEEICKIESSVSRVTRKGKRDYAMLLLASRLGLRVSDIVNLKFQNINWDKSKICLKMIKTQKNIDLPLVADVGNAIIDYLKNGRPQSDLPYIFLMDIAPFMQITAGCATSAISNAITESKILVAKRHHGPHALRHSLASAMINRGTSLPVIADSLGHKTSQSTMKYLKIDMNSLMKCVLPVPSVSDNFYIQKGGLFYE